MSWSEDRTRRPPPFERVLHAVLAIGYGAILAMLAPILIGWAALPTGFVLAGHGLLSWIMSLASLGVGGWSVRNALAAMALGDDGAPIPSAALDHSFVFTRPTLESALPISDQPLRLAAPARTDRPISLPAAA